MRLAISVLFALLGASLALASCAEEPIGQPCDFDWPKDGNCAGYPTCHPLQEEEAVVTVNNRACPVDCIKMPSLECENLICVATQIEENFTNMNGRCWNPEPGEESQECPSSPIRCTGYCTKECLTDASCPKGYKCSAMAPFGSTLKCQDPSQWSTACTNNCVVKDQTPPDASGPCPDTDYANCDLEGYDVCCACICYQFCPLLSKKFCRKEAWDSRLYPAETTNTQCRPIS